jgi:hypothetical protein
MEVNLRLRPILRAVHMSITWFVWVGVWGGRGGGWIWIMLQPAFLVIICSGIVVLKRLLAWYWVEVGIYMVPSFVK